MSEHTKVTAAEMAARLNGREYGSETTKADEHDAKTSGLVIVFGASDDLMEFRGAEYEEIGAYEGATAYFTPAGLLKNDCDNDNCPHFAKMQKAAVEVEAIRDKDGYSWVYDTAIPHAQFDIMEDGGRYCRGIVFALADVAALSKATQP